MKGQVRGQGKVRQTIFWWPGGFCPLHLHPAGMYNCTSTPLHGKTPLSRVRENHHDHKSCHRVMISNRVMRGPNVIRFDRYTYLGKVGRVA
jgi:hypothetical protein